MSARLSPGSTQAVAPYLDPLPGWGQQANVRRLP